LCFRPIASHTQDKTHQLAITERKTAISRYRREDRSGSVSESRIDDYVESEIRHPDRHVDRLPDKARALKTWISEESGDAASIEVPMEASDASKLVLTGPASCWKVCAAVGRWRAIGVEIGMTDGELDPFEPAFEHEERGVVTRLVRR
jgi:hypothetical protein